MLSGVTVDLYVVLKAKQVRDGDNASITMELFEVRTLSDRTIREVIQFITPYWYLSRHIIPLLCDYLR